MKKLKRLSFIFVSILALILVLRLLYKILFFSKSTSLYFYSALLQGNAAMISLVGVFFVFKKQELKNYFSHKEKIITDYLKSTCNIIINYADIFIFENYNDDIFKNLTAESKNKLIETMRSAAWVVRFEELHNIANKIKELNNKSSLPIILIFSILLASVLILPMSNFIHKYYYIEFSLFTIFCLVEGVTFIKTYKFIASQMLDDL